MDLLDWNFHHSLVLMNPKIPSAQKKEIHDSLQQFGLLNHFWIATSGSSSTSNIAPKWVALSKDAIFTSAEAVNKHLVATKNDLWVLALPLFHVGGLGIKARAYLSGSKVETVNGKWDPHRFHRCCHDKKATLTALVPAQLYDLVSRQLEAPQSLRATVIGGGRIGEELYYQAFNLGWKPLPSYGLTECASQVATAPLSSLQEKGVPAIEFLTHISETLITEEGCLQLQSPSLLTTYAEFREGRCDLYDPKINGWFQTEDLATIDNDKLDILGRKTNVVKVGGENVNIDMMNQLLSELSIRAHVQGDHAIVAVPCERLGQKIVLAEAGTPPMQLQNLINTYNERVLPFEQITKVFNVKKIPRTPLMKLKPGLCEFIND